MRIGSVLALSVAVAATRSAPAAAHDLCLIPDIATPAAGSTLRVGLHVGESFPGEATDWRKDAVREFFLLDAQGRLDLKDLASEGTPLMPRLSLRAPGTTLIALATEPRYIELEAREFQKYLKHEGHDDILEMRARMQQGKSAGRERYRRFVKTLVDVGGEGSDVSLANASLTIEIIPETRPASVRAGGRLPVRVLFEGTPYAGGLLCAAHAGASAGHDAYDWCGRLDGAGRAAVPIQAPGWQLLRTTRMRALAGDDKADWVSYWAALTFDVPAGPRSDSRSPR